MVTCRNARSPQGATIAYLPVPAPRAADYVEGLEALAAMYNDGWPVFPDPFSAVRPSYLGDVEALVRDFTEFCELARARDAVAEPAVMDWRLVLDEGEAESRADAHKLLCSRADAVLARLRTGGAGA